jgi:hypothetical protein
MMLAAKTWRCAPRVTKPTHQPCWVPSAELQEPVLP